MATKKRRLRKNARNFLVYLLIGGAVLLLAGFSAFRILELKLEERTLLAQQAELEHQKEKLTEQLAHVNDPEFIEQEARKQLKLIMPGETLYILQDEGDTDGEPDGN
jgi:cell division protein FtsB